MLACRPRPARSFLVSFVSSLHLPAVLLLVSLACAPSDGGSPAGAAGTSGGGGGAGGAVGGAAGTTGTAGSGPGGSTGSGGSAGSPGRGGASAGTTGAGGSSAGSGGGGQSGTAGRGGTGGGAGGASGSGGATAGNAGTGGGATAGSGGTAGAGGATAGRGGSGGASAGTGGTGGSAVATTCNGGPPSPPAAGVNFPFPQHRASSACIYPPSCSDADMAMGWAAYKSALIVADGTDGSMRVIRPTDGNDTVSEGISYGMLFSVYMNDKATFDALWKYEQKHLDARGLMHWRIAANGTTAGMNSATDADEDMAFALVMADKQWGGYATTALAELTKVAANDFQADGTIKGGDTYAAVNPSYLAPAFYRVFAAYVDDATDRARWMTILDKSYEILAMVQNATTGLVPNWSAGRNDPVYGYDATRTPYRVALDACWSNDPRAKTFSQKIGAFFAGIGAANIVDGYNQNGTVTGSYKNSTFVGPAGAAGMASNQPQLVADAYTRVAADAKAAATNYYDRSWALFTVMLMTGNFVNFQAP
jgi:endo-1,4-beta-D-glucanase Y